VAHYGLFVNPHDISLWGLWVNLGFAAGFDFAIEPGVVPVNLFDPALFQRTLNDDLSLKPSASQLSSQLCEMDAADPQ
jgi:choline-sulfatase